MKTVLAHGVFDLMHLGHVRHLKHARKAGDILVVSVVADEFVRKDRPLIYKEAQRIAMLWAIRYVDRVILCAAPGPEKIIESLRPDVYVRGPDYIGKDMPEGVLLKTLGIPVQFTDDFRWRSTLIIEKIRDQILQ